MYFGRDGELISALKTFDDMHTDQRGRLFVILGPSGTGKSSFRGLGCCLAWTCIAIASPFSTSSARGAAKPSREKPVWLKADPCYPPAPGVDHSHSRGDQSRVDHRRDQGEHPVARMPRTRDGTVE